MTSNHAKDFIEWLDRQLLARGWSDNKLARLAGLSHSVISRARAGSLPKWAACEALAQALDLPPVAVFRKAGLLPDTSLEEVDLDEWRYLLAKLPEDDRYELLRIAHLKLELMERRKEK